MHLMISTAKVTWTMFLSLLLGPVLKCLSCVVVGRAWVFVTRISDYIASAAAISCVALAILHGPVIRTGLRPVGAVGVLSVAIIVIIIVAIVVTTGIGVVSIIAAEAVVTVASPGVRPSVVVPTVVIWLVVCSEPNIVWSLIEV